jgi:outer membrane receptor protein involved in Fe transport
MRNAGFVLRLCAVAVCFIGAASAQGTGTLYGTVTDPSGAVVAAARVDAVLTERGAVRTVTTDANGQYVFSLMPIGSYEINVEATGFRRFRRSGVTLDANQNVRVDAALVLGSITEAVTISANATPVESRSAMLDSLIEDRRLTELPINGRNIVSLLSILPGASQVSAPQTFTGDRSGPTVSVSGSRENANLFLFDGQDFNATFRNTGLNFPPPDAVQEIKVLTSSFSAEYGRNSGGILNVVTKSGTNQLHGTLWEFVRNGAFNARNFFSLSNPQLEQNQFGAAAGGPIKKDKLFVFGSYEGLRIRQGSLFGSGYPLTASERAGTFAGKAVNDPLNSQPFPGNQIPSTRFDTVAQAILSKNLMQLPNTPAGTFVETYPTPQNNDQGVIRVDYNLGAKHVIDARYNHNLATEINPVGNIAEYLPRSYIARSQSITIGDTYIITPTLLNQFRIAYNRNGSSIDPGNHLSLADLGGNFPIIGGHKIPPSINISGRITLGQNSSIDATIANETRQISDTLSWTKGRHSVRAGFELLLLRYLNRTYWFSMGDFSFTGAITGNPAADFLIGKPATATVGSPVLEQGGIQWNFYQYVQDDWRISNRLTLNLGLRYELPLPWVHPHNFWGTFHAGQQSTVIPSAPAGLVYYGDKGVPRGMIQTDKNNFAPRVGFAWDVFGDGRTSVRGGFGIFYEGINANIIQNSTQPFRYQFAYSAPYSLSDPLRGQAPLPLTTDLSHPAFFGTQQIVYPDSGDRAPYVEQFSLAVQREVVRDTVIQASYVGKLGHRQLMGISSNPAIYIPGGSTLSNLNQRRIYSGFGDNSIMATVGNSSYHALQLEGRKRFSHRFSIQGAYAFSKSIDQSSSTSPESGAVPQPFNLATERGLSTFSAAHVGSLSWIVDLPSLEGQPAALRLIGGGWQWNGLFTARSGLPLNPTIGSDVALTGTSNQRPNVVGNWRLPSGRSHADEIAAWFSATAFAAPPTGIFGNAGRNVLFGPPQASVNAGLFKTFNLPFRESAKLQFRSEFFNVLNQVNLGSPNVQVSGGKMGRITSAGSPRVLQFALKLLF